MCKLKRNYTALLYELLYSTGLKHKIVGIAFMCLNEQFPNDPSRISDNISRRSFRASRLILCSCQDTQKVSLSSSLGWLCFQPHHDSRQCSSSLLFQCLRILHSFLEYFFHKNRRTDIFLYVFAILVPPFTLIPLGPFPLCCSSGLVCRYQSNFWPRLFCDLQPHCQSDNQQRECKLDLSVPVAVGAPARKWL